MENRPLTAIRGVAAVAVVIFHLSVNVPGHWPACTAYGQFGVDVFFILSGYVLTLVYADLTPAGLLRFWSNRVGRIFPLHIAVLTTLVAGVLAMLHTGWTTRDPAFFDPATLPYHYSLTFVWFGFPLGWNSPTWSLCVELAAYILFPVWLFTVRRLPRAAVATLGLACVVGAASHLVLDGPASIGATAMTRGLLEFATGTLLRLATIHPIRLRFVETVGDVTLNYPPIVWLGRISYSIYLLHAPLLIVWLKIAPGLGPLLTAAAFLLVLLPLSQLTFLLIERPGQELVRTVFMPRRTTTSPRTRSTAIPPAGEAPANCVTSDGELVSRRRSAPRGDVAQ